MNTRIEKKDEESSGPLAAVAKILADCFVCFQVRDDCHHSAPARLLMKAFHLWFRFFLPLTLLRWSVDIALACTELALALTKDFVRWGPVTARLQVLNASDLNVTDDNLVDKTPKKSETEAEDGKRFGRTQSLEDRYLFASLFDVVRYFITLAYFACKLWALFIIIPLLSYQFFFLEACSNTLHRLAGLDNGTTGEDEASKANTSTKSPLKNDYLPLTRLSHKKWLADYVLNRITSNLYGFPLIGLFLEMLGVERHPNFFRKMHKAIKENLSMINVRVPAGAPPKLLTVVTDINRYIDGDIAPYFNLDHTYNEDNDPDYVPGESSDDSTDDELESTRNDENGTSGGQENNIERDNESNGTKGCTNLAGEEKKDLSGHEKKQEAPANTSELRAEETLEQAGNNHQADAVKRDSCTEKGKDSKHVIEYNAETKASQNANCKEREQANEDIQETVKPKKSESEKVMKHGNLKVSEREEKTAKMDIRVEAKKKLTVETDATKSVKIEATETLKKEGTMEKVEIKEYKERVNVTETLHSRENEEIAEKLEKAESAKKVEPDEEVKIAKEIDKVGNTEEEDDGIDPDIAALLASNAQLDTVSVRAGMLNKAAAGSNDSSGNAQKPQFQLEDYTYPDPANLPLPASPATLSPTKRVRYPIVKVSRRCCWPGHEVDTITEEDEPQGTGDDPDSVNRTMKQAWESTGAIPKCTCNDKKLCKDSGTKQQEDGEEKEKNVSNGGRDSSGSAHKEIDALLGREFGLSELKSVQDKIPQSDKILSVAETVKTGLLKRSERQNFIDPRFLHSPECVTQILKIAQDKSLFDQQQTIKSSHLQKQNSNANTSANDSLFSGITEDAAIHDNKLTEPLAGDDLANDKSPSMVIHGSPEPTPKRPESISTPLSSLSSMTSYDDCESEKDGSTGFLSPDTKIEDVERKHEMVPGGSKEDKLKSTFEDDTNVDDGEPRAISGDHTDVDSKQTSEPGETSDVGNEERAVSSGCTGEDKGKQEAESRGCSDVDTGLSADTFQE